MCKWNHLFSAGHGDPWPLGSVFVRLCVCVLCQMSWIVKCDSTWHNQCVRVCISMCGIVLIFLSWCFELQLHEYYWRALSLIWFANCFVKQNRQRGSKGKRALDSENRVSSGFYCMWVTCISCDVCIADVCNVFFLGLIEKFTRKRKLCTYPHVICKLWLFLPWNTDMIFHTVKFNCYHSHQARFSKHDFQFQSVPHSYYMTWNKSYGLHL